LKGGDTTLAIIGESLQFRFPELLTEERSMSKKCEECKGTGQVADPDDEGESQVKCDDCGGTGEIDEGEEDDEDEEDTDDDEENEDNEA
jgi:adenine-specific DNA methylase